MVFSQLKIYKGVKWRVISQPPEVVGILWQYKLKIGFTLLLLEVDSTSFTKPNWDFFQKRWRLFKQTKGRMKPFPHFRGSVFFFQSKRWMDISRLSIHFGIRVRDFRSCDNIIFVLPAGWWSDVPEIRMGKDNVFDWLPVAKEIVFRGGSGIVGQRVTEPFDARQLRNGHDGTAHMLIPCHWRNKDAAPRGRIRRTGFRPIGN